MDTTIAFAAVRLFAWIGLVSVAWIVGITMLRRGVRRVRSTPATPAPAARADRRLRVPHLTH